MIMKWIFRRLYRPSSCGIGRVDCERGMSDYVFGIHRGLKVINFFKRNGIKLEKSFVLDIGCNKGGIDIAFSPFCQRIVAGDIDVERLKVAKARFKARRIKNIDLIRFDGSKLPFKRGVFRLVIINGVLEWIPWKHQETPLDIQIRSLKEVYYVLKLKGLLYLAIENRLFPGYLIIDPHIGLPLTALVPRFIADLITRSILGFPYKNYIYSYWELMYLLMKTGFKRVEVFVGIPSYQFPLEIISVHCSNKDFSKAITRAFRSKLIISLINLIVITRTLRIFWPNFIVLAQKSR